MTRLRIADLLAVSPVDPERYLDPKRVEMYRRFVDDLPPVEVFETKEGLLLADGHHRVAAAVREGRETIEATVRSGSRHDALEYAVAVGVRQRGLAPEEIRQHIMDGPGPHSVTWRCSHHRHH